MALDFKYRIDLEQRLGEFERKTKRRRMDTRKVLVKTSGTPVRHNLGKVPDEFSIVPLANVTWWFYREPDSINIYLQSSADAEFLVSVAGG